MLEPETIRNTRFSQAKNGFNPTEVIEFLNELANEVEAVLAVGRLLSVSPLVGVAAGIVGHLEAGMAEAVADLDALPRDDGLGLLPAELSDRRSGVRDALVHIDALLLKGLDALDLASFSPSSLAFRFRSNCSRTGTSE